jgi:CHAT domain-containing protein
VLVSRWEVGDESTAELMERFYRRLYRDGLSPAAALRAAQLSMWREERWRAPYHWGAFVLQGEPR